MTSKIPGTLFKNSEKAAANSPVKQSQGIHHAQRTSGSFRGSMRDWRPLVSLFNFQNEKERETTEIRVEDLFRNDGVTRSVVNSLTTNVIGKGLTPQSILPYKRLGITAEKAREIQDQIEWLWFEWCENAHYRGQCTFETLQAMAVRSLVRSGEFIHLPIMEKHPRPGCRFRLRIQDIDPRRLRSPISKAFDPTIHDGVEVDETGIPIAYWIYSPKPIVGYLDPLSASEQDFIRYPARLRLGRKGIFHIFKCEEDEQYRGSSALAPILTFLRNFTDSIDNELLGQVIASSFPIFIELENGVESGMPEFVKEEEFSKPEEKRFYQNIDGGGQIMYGNAGEKPQVLENSRPSSNFQTFCTLLLRIIGASLELPYEVISKDFSKTNYSSARAALLEAYRVYDTYRSNIIRQYCQPIFEMVLEESFLSKFISLPCTVSEFYKDKKLWSNTRWVAPARGYIDPVKEVQSQIQLIDAGLMSRSEAIAERGGDFDDVLQRLADEDNMIEKLRPNANLIAKKEEKSFSEPESEDESVENDDLGQNTNDNEQKNGKKTRKNNNNDKS